MTKKKYQYREQGSETTFDKKNDFINFCQEKYQESLKLSSTTVRYYSYDFGETWNPISNFKSDRQNIQNEKKPQSQSDTNHTPQKTNWFTYLIYLFFIWLGLSYFNVKIDKIGFVNEFNGRVFGWDSKFVRVGSLNEILNQNDNEQQTINEEEQQTVSEEEQPENTSTNNLNEEQSLNDFNSETESNDNSSNTYQEPETQQQQQQPCFGCKGTGECRSCSKTFRVHYWDDRSNGWKDRNESRRGYTMCDDCDGSGVKYKRSDFPNQGKWEIERKCYVSSCKDGWIFCRECNNGGSGRDIGKCKECRGSGYRN
jgi:hypothetical protein